MPKVAIYNLKRESVGEIELADEVFGASVNENVIYEVLKAQLAQMVKTVRMGKMGRMA